MKSKEQPTQSVKILDLDQLQKLVETPMQCQFKLDNTLIEVEVKRMTPLVAERHRKILRDVQPPYNATRKDYDPLDAKYLESRDRAEDKARAIIVYYCCPIVSAKKTCENDEEIYQFVNRLFTRHIQELIALTAQSGGMNVVKGANFTLPDGSDI